MIGLYPKLLLDLIGPSFDSPLFEGLRKGGALMKLSRTAQTGRAGNHRGHDRAGGAGGGSAGDARRAVAESLLDRRGICGIGLRCGIGVAAGDRPTRHGAGRSSAGSCRCCKGMFVDDPLTRLVKVALLALTIFTS